MSADVFLDPQTGDLPSAFRFTTKIELILQKARIRMETFLGEWILDQRKGLPFLRWRRFKIPPLDEILNLTQREMTGIEGVLRVFDPAIRIDTRVINDRQREVVCVEMSVAIPREESIRVRLDLFGAGLGRTETEGFPAPNLTGSDPVDDNTTPFVVVYTIAGTL